MTPDKITAIAQACHDHTTEISALSAEILINQIDRALSTDDRSVLIESGYIPESRDKLDLQGARLHRLVLDNLQSAKDMMSEGARAFVELPLVSKEMDNVIGKAMTSLYETSKLKESIIQDIHTGTGPLNPETIIVLKQLAEQIRKKAQEQSNTPLPEMPQDEDAQPMIAAMIFMGIPLANAMSEILKEARDIEGHISPLPSEEDVVALRDYIDANDELFKEVVAEYNEQANAFGM